jgi:hypothetical protein
MSQAHPTVEQLPPEIRSAVGDVCIAMVLDGLDMSAFVGLRTERLKALRARHRLAADEIDIALQLFDALLSARRPSRKRR